MAKEQYCDKCGYTTGDTRTSRCPNCSLPYKCDYPECDTCHYKVICEKGGAKVSNSNMPTW